MYFIRPRQARGLAVCGLAGTPQDTRSASGMTKCFERCHSELLFYGVFLIVTMKVEV